MGRRTLYARGASNHCLGSLTEPRGKQRQRGDTLAAAGPLGKLFLSNEGKPSFEFHRSRMRAGAGRLSLARGFSSVCLCACRV